MKRLFTTFAGLGLVIGLGLVSAQSAAAADNYTVCANGCPYSTIQAAINDPAAGSIITVKHGTYVENVVVTRSVTLEGENQASTRVLPSVSDPDCSDPTSGSSLCTGASNIILVQANDVTISGFTLDGANPNLTGGVLVDGASINARNGIIENFHAGTLNDLDVHDVTVLNVYLRGIYASSGGTFNFYDDTVNNVQGNSSSIAMFNFGGAGTFAGNTVSAANDAISSNWSSGVKFLNNTITGSGSGVHTDNSGEYGTKDLIQGNTVRNCMPGGYGIFVFVPYTALTVQNNTILHCSVGLSLFGGSNSSAVSFENNSVNNSNAAGSIGVLVTSDEVGYGCSAAFAALTGNVITNNETGVQLLQGPAFTGDPCTPPGSVTVSLHYNNILNNGTGLLNQSGNPSTDATNNWWGCSQGPNAPGCDTIVDTAPAVTNYTPFLLGPA